MATRFTLRALPDGEQSKERSLKRTLAGLRRRVGERGPHTLEYNGVKYNREHSTREMLLRVNELLRKANGPERIKIHPSRGPVQAIRKVVVQTEIPHINTPGTDEIDEIYSALHAQFGPQWPVRDMGICVDKPGSPYLPPEAAWSLPWRTRNFAMMATRRQVSSAGMSISVPAS